MNPEIRSAVEIDPETLGAFLGHSFHPAKARFLLEHGTWKHRGADHQMVLVDGSEVIGYCGVIPAGCRVGDATLDAVWWVDLVIDPAFRGRGLQTLFDERIRSMTQLKLGFPNALAAKIHRKHGWGVREDYETLLLPLRPRRLRTVKRATGARRLALETAAMVLEPAARIFRRRMGRYSAGHIERVDTINSTLLAGVFEQSHPRSQTTTVRDAEYLEWRYNGSPDREEMAAYLADGCLAAIVRTLHRDSPPEVRVLDAFGAVDRGDLLIDLLKTIARDANQLGASQVTLFSTLSTLGRAAREAGFRVPGDGRFCWYSDDPSTHRRIANSPQHWVLGDSDHDEPV